MLANIFEASLLKGEGRFELRYVPQLHQYTKKEEVSIKSSLYRPIETIGLIVFTLKWSLYLSFVALVGNFLLANGPGFYHGLLFSISS